MPTWSNELPVEGKHMGFDLRRTPTAGAIQGIITCEDILVVPTHYYHGRTTPCERPDCPACRESMPYRTHVYVSAFNEKKREHFLFECTAAAAKPLAEFKAANGSLRGCIIHASRPKCKPNAKVWIQTGAVDRAKVFLPEPPDVQRALCVIWRIPLPAIEIQHLPDGTPTTRVRSKRLTSMREQPDNMGEPQSIGDILSGNGHAA
jgi:hypothetical protein